MPKIAEIEYTPNPNAVKFVLKEPVTSGFPKAFRDKEMAEYDELAKGLFAVRHVASVFMQDKFVTVTKDDGVGWTELLPKLAPPIRQAPSAAGQAAPAPPHWDRPEVDENDPIIQEVRKVLADAILARPGRRRRRPGHRRPAREAGHDPLPGRLHLLPLGPHRHPHGHRRHPAQGSGPGDRGHLGLIGSRSR